MASDYIKRIDLVLTYIEDNLQGDLSLNTIARIGLYSPFHLHRLFRAITNETLNNYITRKRIERSAHQLIHNHHLSISEIAFQNGFKSHSNYTRTFVKVYGMNPASFRISNKSNFSKIGKADSKNRKGSFITEEYLCNIEHLKKYITMNASISIQQVPDIHLAYITQIGVNGLENAFNKLLRWAAPKGVLAQPGANVMRVFHDSFKITDEDKVRMSIGISVAPDFEADEVVNIIAMKGGKCIVGRFEIPIEEFEPAWNSLFIWMNENGYRKADRNPFEIYHNNYMDHPEQKCIVDLCIPVE